MATPLPLDSMDSCWMWGAKCCERRGRGRAQEGEAGWQGCTLKASTGRP